MNMTEIEARGKIKYRIANEMRKAGENKEEYEDLEIAIQALKEIREYRELGTVEELKALKIENAELHCEMQAMGATMDLFEKEIREKAIDDVIEKAKEIQEEQIKNLEQSTMRNGKRWAMYMNTYLGHIQVACKGLIAEQMKGGATDERTGSN